MLVLMHLGYYNPIAACSEQLRGVIVTVWAHPRPPPVFDAYSRNNIRPVTLTCLLLFSHRSRQWTVEGDETAVGAFVVKTVQPILGATFDQQLRQYKLCIDPPPPEMTPDIQFSLTNDPWSVAGYLRARGTMPRFRPKSPRELCSHMRLIFGMLRVG